MSSVFLVGFMGSGKTTVGRLLAERLGWSFIDVDERIVEAEGRTLPEIFADGGEAAFRAAEERALRDVVKAADAVVATGGGLFSRPGNRQLIAETGNWSVFLDVPWQVLEARLGRSDPGRPLWRSPAEAKVLFESRLSDYRRADVVMTLSGDETPAAVAEAIARMSPRFACAI
jgi:shikimate kinase